MFALSLVPHLWKAYQTLSSDVWIGSCTITYHLNAWYEYLLHFLKTILNNIISIATKQTNTVPTSRNYDETVLCHCTTPKFVLAKFSVKFSSLFERPSGRTYFQIAIPHRCDVCTIIFRNYTNVSHLTLSRILSPFSAAMWGTSSRTFTSGSVKCFTFSDAKRVAELLSELLFSDSAVLYYNNVPSRTR